jgi:hypothetical protein
MMVLVTAGWVLVWMAGRSTCSIFSYLGGHRPRFREPPLNQVFSRLDARMRRTRNRPLPGRRMTLDEGLIIRILCSAGGILWLSIATNIYAGLLSA